MSTFLLEAAEGSTRPFPLATDLTIHQVNVDGQSRKYGLLVPDKFDSEGGAALVVMFHGGGGTADNAMHDTGWHIKAQQQGFIVAFPEGTPPDPQQKSDFRKNPQAWNDGSGRFHVERMGINDASFTRALIEDIKGKAKIDPRRIFLTGFSNGSSLVYRLGYELDDIVAAIAPVGSSGLRITAAKPLGVSLIAIHGALDPINPVQGGAVRNLGSKAVDNRPPIEDSVSRWAKMLGCRQNPLRREEISGVLTSRYKDCRASRTKEAVLHLVQDLGHSWPGGHESLPQWLVGPQSSRINATDVIWQFFVDHPKDEGADTIPTKR